MQALQMSAQAGKRFVRLMASLLLLCMFTAGMAPAQGLASMRVHASAQTDKTSVKAGDAVTVNVQITSPETTSVLVDLEIFDASLKRVKQLVVDQVALSAGETRTVPIRWDVASDLPEGRYIVSFGIFGAGWSSSINQWFAAAASLQVAAGEPALSFTSSAAVQPSVVTVGGSVYVRTSVAASLPANAVVEVGLHGPDGARVLTKTFPEYSFPANVPQTFDFSWTPGTDALSGAYRIEVGVYSPDRSAQHHLNRNAGSFSVKGSETRPPLPAPSQLQAVPVSKQAIALAWSGVTGSDRYEVEADGAVAASIRETAFTHDGLAPDSSHTYRVRAVDDEGTAGAWSAPVQARTAPADPPAGGIQVKVKTGTDTSSAMMGPNFQLINTSGKPVKLSDVKLRYYYTIDGEELPLSIGFWSTASGAPASVLTRFVKMPTPAADADHYLEIGFSDAAGSLASGADVGINTWINKSDWSAFTLNNDYSFSGSSSLADNRKTTGYLSGTKVWGEEPSLLAMPPFPSGIEAVPADEEITLSWQEVPGATGYDVKADGVVEENIQGTAFKHSWLMTGTRHTYQIRTRQGESVSVWSPLLSVKTTGLQHIPAPTGMKAVKSDTSIALTWSAPDALITGYDIEVDGTVVDTGMTAAYKHEGLEPGTAHTYRVRAKEDTTLGLWSDLQTVNTTYTPNGPFNVQIEVDASAGRQPISPFIYGTNDDLTGEEQWTARRMGGNRLSTYNWENNASNSGDDAAHHNDAYVAHYYGGIPWSEKGDQPAAGVTGFHDRSLAEGAYTLATLPVAGYAARDTNGYVLPHEKAPSSRWVEVKAAKNGPFSLIPDLTDNYAYSDELVNLLKHKYGGAGSPTGIRGYSIDNEPGIWPKTHPYMHPAKAGAAEVLSKGIELSKAVKNVDPDAEMFGPASYGFDDMYAMQLAADWPSLKAGYSWYMDYYLDKFRAASQQENRRLLDALDFHWYPETSGGGYRIQDPKGSENPETNKARLQAPRQFWDTSYTEDTYFYREAQFAKFFPLIPRVQESINQYNPGTKIAVTEYNFGAEHNIYGGLAQADALGIFGKTNVYMANFWRMTDGQKGSAYITTAMKLYTNYDGNNSKFGDTKIKAETSDIENSSVYGSVYRDSDNKLHLIVINKNTEHEMQANLKLAGGTAYTSARVWAFDESGPVITEREPVASIQDNQFVYTIPKLTACHIVLSAE
ncbi:Fibronectin type III domain-containing protein [Paenibacillus sp. UNCCL117]|uniref:glycoside hydrolase family 44 protein n=1 Tax=unclassified Paenibacillus TaxID=185978 RepID=UPI000888A17D|nr:MULTISPECIES: glycoside hydrolase family 44 protein [unclassified Paenibacillus]SDC24462.1 Fibronectin type III domain-containing protein [Paenibacillus sp. cl123]SFW19571.1 Fibronectin type III domain-containing protein [Paenibacillus sp. UNCCL117]